MPFLLAQKQHAANEEPQDRELLCSVTSFDSHCARLILPSQGYTETDKTLRPLLPHPGGSV